MLEGVVVKAYGGFYYVLSDDQIWECYLRGRIRKSGSQVLVGDMVRFKMLEEDERGVIEEVLPRRNSLIRPPVANVDQAVVIFSLKEPEPNLMLLDRILVQAEAAGVSSLICLNKVDLLDGTEGDLVGELKEIYAGIGYRLFVTSAATGYGIEELRQSLKGKISVLAGPSGVGKSSLLNALQPGLSLKVGSVSKKLKRGRHTTRYVELLVLEGGGLVADTPGFSSLYLPDVKREELPALFPEFGSFAVDCRFAGCLHYKEPDCAVRAAVGQKQISFSRYQHYLRFLQEIIDAERRY